MFSLIFSIGVSPGPLFAVETPDDLTYRVFRRKIKSPICRKRLDGLKEFRLLFSELTFRTLLVEGKSPLLPSKLLSWSSDLLIKIVLDLEQNYQVLCPEHPQLDLVLDHLKRSYLLHVGLPFDRYSERETDQLFRGLLVLKDEVPVLKKALEKVRENTNTSAILTKLYGDFRKVRHVPVFAAGQAAATVLDEIVGEVCANLSPCPFWDTRLIYKVLVNSEPATAAYIPEVGVLILSRELLDIPHRLHRLVVLHELAHVAARGAWIYQRRKWVDSFAAFSGWKKSDTGKWSTQVRKPAFVRSDNLTELSRTSSFSVLPDPLYLGFPTKNNILDGFVFGKSYEESLRANDPSEDLADHIAAYRYAPERFCYQGKNMAPRKYAWIAKQIFNQKPPPLKCPKPEPVKVAKPTP